MTTVILYNSSRGVGSVPKHFSPSFCNYLAEIQKEARKYWAEVPCSAAAALLQNDDVEQLNVGLV